MDESVFVEGGPDHREIARAGFSRRSGPKDGRRIREIGKAGKKPAKSGIRSPACFRIGWRRSKLSGVLWSDTARRL